MARISLARVPLEKLQSEIERRLKELPKLIAERDELNRRIAELEGLTAAAPAAQKPKARPKKKRRAKRAPARKGKLTLKDALVQVMEGKEAVSVPEATDGVLALGYETRVKDPRLVVNRALYQDDRFERVKRGVYTLKK